jgi:hypothetical protein
VAIKRKPSFLRNAMAGVTHVAINRPPWELIAIIGLSVAALANIMLFVKKKTNGG